MRLFVIIYFLFINIIGIAQADSVAKKPSTKKNLPQTKLLAPQKILTKDSALKSNAALTNSSNIKDSVAIDSNKIQKDSIVKNISTSDTSNYSLLNNNPILSNVKPELMITAFKESSSKDILFYALLFIVIILAIVKLIFPRYVKNIFAIIFQTQFRQIQTREQLLQDNVASMLLNILFIITGSFFIALSLDTIGFAAHGFWQLVLSSLIALTSIYLFKLLFTQFLGWIFNKSAAAKNYNFVVFMINKVVGIVLIPFLFLISFSDVFIAQKIIVVSLIIVGILLLLRLFLTFKNTSSILKINAFHFFLYFCCVEILPLLIMFKFLKHYISNGI